MKRLVLLATLLLTPSIALGATLNQNIWMGASGPGVSVLQQFLTDQGLYSGPISGRFGPLTKKAVTTFQTSEGITPVTGYVGPVTRVVINKILAGQVPPSGGNATTTKSVADLSQQQVPPPNSNLCNGVYYTSCPSGQDVVCPSNGGKAYCQNSPQQLQANLAAQNTQLIANLETQLQSYQNNLAQIKTSIADVDSKFNQQNCPSILTAPLEFQQGAAQVQTTENLSICYSLAQEKTSFTQEEAPILNQISYIQNEIYTLQSGR